MNEATGSPRATRLATPSWLDGRLVLGVLLVLVSVLVGAKVLAGADTSQEVWVAAHDLAPGSVVVDGDLTHGRARLFGAGGKYVAGSKPVGYVVQRPVAQGELLPAAALVDPGRSGARRDVTVAVATGHLPPDLTRGDQVDVYVTPDDKARRTSTEALTPHIVLRAVTVARLGRSGGLAATGQEQPVVLTVAPGDVLTLVQAMGQGTLDLVRVPRGQQVPLTRADPATPAP